MSGGVCVLECKDFKQPLRANNPSKGNPRDLAKAAAMRIAHQQAPLPEGLFRRIQEEESRLSPWAAA
eukprot:1147949-Pelagomonas_calceolata.AAC.1